jgi:hypothetical protein
MLISGQEGTYVIGNFGFCAQDGKEIGVVYLEQGDDVRQGTVEASLVPAEIPDECRKEEDSGIDPIFTLFARPVSVQG